MLHNFAIQWNEYNLSTRERMEHTHITVYCYIQYILHYTPHHHHCMMRRKSDHMTLEKHKVLFQTTNKCYESFLLKAATPPHMHYERQKQLASQKWQAHKHTNRTKRMYKRENRRKKHAHQHNSFLLCVLVFNMTTFTTATMKIM